MEEGQDIPSKLVRERMRTIRSEVERLERLRVELEALERLAIQAVAEQHASRKKRFGPTQAVISVLRNHPRRAADVVNLVVDRVVSSSRDVKRTLFTTIGHMRKNGRLVERSDGSLDLAENCIMGNKLIQA